jgi:hypothetical protein
MDLHDIINYTIIVLASLLIIHILFKNMKVKKHRSRRSRSRRTESMVNIPTFDSVFSGLKNKFSSSTSADYTNTTTMNVDGPIANMTVTGINTEDSEQELNSQGESESSYGVESELGSELGSEPEATIEQTDPEMESFGDVNNTATPVQIPITMSVMPTIPSTTSSSTTSTTSTSMILPTTISSTAENMNSRSNGPSASNHFAYDEENHGFDFTKSPLVIPHVDNPNRYGFKTSCTANQNDKYFNDFQNSIVISDSRYCTTDKSDKSGLPICASDVDRYRVSSETPNGCQVNKADREVGEYMRNMILDNQHYCGTKSSEENHKKPDNFAKEFFSFRDQLWQDSHQNDMTEKVVRMYLEGNTDVINKLSGKRIKDVYDDMTKHNSPYQRNCVRVPDYDDSTHDTYYTAPGAQNRSFKKDNWIYQNEKVINGGAVDSNLYPFDPESSNNSYIQ